MENKVIKKTKNHLNIRVGRTLRKRMENRPLRTVKKNFKFYRSNSRETTSFSSL